MFRAGFVKTAVTGKWVVQKHLKGLAQRAHVPQLLIKGDLKKAESLPGADVSLKNLPWYERQNLKHNTRILNRNTKEQALHALGGLLGLRGSLHRQLGRK
jgi:hypothetical protein